MSAKISVIDGKPFVQLDGETLSPPDAILALRSLQTEAAEDLNRAETALADAEREHGAVLANGEEPDRDIVVAAKASIDLARKAVKSIEDDLRRVHSSVIDHEAARMIGAVAAEVKQDTGIRPDLTEAIARRVAELGLQLGIAEAEHGKALAEVENVHDRVNGIDQRIGEITKKRLEGDATAGNASELAALDYDIGALREIMDQANQKAASLDPSELRSRHQRAVVDWGRHVLEARLKALASVVQSREKELVDALSELAECAHSAGSQSLTGLWSPSDPLNTFVTRTLLSAMPRRAA